MGLSCNEYVILDTVFLLSRKSGWCYLTRENMAKNIGATKQAVINIVERLIERGFLVKNDKGSLATTELWENPQLSDDLDGKESLPGGYKKFTDTVKKVYQTGKESLPNNNIDNNNKNKDNNISERFSSSHVFEIPDFDKLGFTTTPKDFSHPPLHEKTNLVGSKEWRLEKFDIFWDKYGKKKATAKVKAKWMLLKVSQIETILEVVDDHVIITPVVQYRKHPLTWLTGECWSDDIQDELKRYKPRTLIKKQTETDYDSNSY